MDTTVVKEAGEAKALSGKAKLVLAAVLTAAMAAGALALFQPSASPAGSSGVVSGAGAPLVSPAREMFEQHEDQAKSTEVAAATRRQEELKDRWLERVNAPNEVTAPAEREMFEQHRFLAQRSEDAAALAAAARHWREMKARGGVGSPSQISPAQ
jgi:hypothetical protein